MKWDYTKIFNKVEKHLLTQNERCVDDGGDCVYRGDNGLRCAIGKIIPNRLYHKKIETENAGNEIVLKVIPYKFKPKNAGSFLGALQHIHDSIPVIDWKNRLQKFREIQLPRFIKEGAK